MRVGTQWSDHICWVLRPQDLRWSIMKSQNSSCNTLGIDVVQKKFDKFVRAQGMRWQIMTSQNVLCNTSGMPAGRRRPTESTRSRLALAYQAILRLVLHYDWDDKAGSMFTGCCALGDRAG